MSKPQSKPEASRDNPLLDVRMSKSQSKPEDSPDYPLACIGLDMRISKPQSTPEITLTYFDAKGSAEFARLLLAYGGLQYKDERVPLPWDDKEAWAKRSASLPYGDLPQLTWDGELVFLPSAICRFIAREVGLVGKNSLEMAQADEIVEALAGVVDSGIDIIYTKDPAKKVEKTKKHMDKRVPDIMDRLERRLVDRGGQFMAGNALTWADLQLYNVCSDMFLDVTFLYVGHVGKGHKLTLERLPKIKNLVGRIGELPNIKQWISRRPKSKM